MRQPVRRVAGRSASNTLTGCRSLIASCAVFDRHPVGNVRAKPTRSGPDEPPGEEPEGLPARSVLRWRREFGPPGPS
jgi:hypothetical protein